MYKILISTIIGGIIGWITNIIAIKMLFKPTKPFRIRALGLEIQGLLPKRRFEIAKVIGETIEEELIDFKEIFERIVDDENCLRIVNLVKSKVTQAINQKLPLLMPQILKNILIQYVEEQIEKESKKILEDLIENIYEKTSQDIKIGKIVEEKINMFDLAKIEEITLKIARKELKHIEMLGGVLGAIIGLLQGLILFLFI
ncbi:MAG TPA: DUF445 family protein [Clostridiales bacterium]|nr:DUF445 family protein [Clostridiales bacterium]